MQHGHAVWTSSMDMHQWHAAWKCIIDMPHGDMDMRRGKSAWHIQHINAACTCIMYMRHVDATCTCMIVLQHEHEHSAWASGINMQHGHASWTWVMDTNHDAACSYKQHRHAAWRHAHAPLTWTCIRHAYRPGHSAWKWNATLVLRSLIPLLTNFRGVWYPSK
jgi:hypothetical protein